MKFLTSTLIMHAPDPVTGVRTPTTERFRQVIDKVHRNHEQFGHTVMHLHAEAGGLSAAQHRASLELFQAEIAPVLRRDIPDPLWPWAPVTAAGLAAAAPNTAVPTPA